MLQIDLSKDRRAGIKLHRQARLFCRFFFQAFLTGTQIYWQKEDFRKYLEQTKNKYQ